ncbi:intracellular channel protein 4 [Seminavis robusta]|uniref:glutathione dehydrogenase (ascorbate) n=1 Tax=Seminavis robusta TaxID=568900 RepID=A0A9N8DZ86_9STRA|nr:intracellular channel protein 4 [Seminavis robusta]|eukprot:Sro470_g149420.1 intracellular channel protein 4 (292) ;mRNA; f:6509-7552
MKKSLLQRIALCTLFAAVAQFPAASGFHASFVGSTSEHHARISSASALFMVQNRGLEVRRDGATPSEGGMSLYLKAGPDGTSVGDCPFAHFVRMVLEEKGLEYDLLPSVQETKPRWLVDHYEGKMPALRHRKECYVESSVIAEYLDFFFREPELKGSTADMEAAEAAIDGIFPAIAKYLKHTPDGDDDDLALKAGLEEKLTGLETHLSSAGRTGPFLVGNGDKMTLIDCSLAPKLYHMETGLEGFKNKSIDLQQQFPKVRAYMDAVFARPSFEATVYPTETVLWGWGNARS